jgi:hypothetical protein
MPSLVSSARVLDKSARPSLRHHPTSLPKILRINRKVSNAKVSMYSSHIQNVDTSRSPSSGSFLHVQLPSETLCTENLTPFLKLVPCKGVSGISGLMKPYILLAHDWHAMGIDYTSNEDDSATDLLLWWEAVVDPIDWQKHTSRGKSSPFRSFSCSEICI